MEVIRKVHNNNENKNFDYNHMLKRLLLCYEKPKSIHKTQTQLKPIY